MATKKGRCVTIIRELKNLKKKLRTILQSTFVEQRNEPDIQNVYIGWTKDLP